MADFSPQDDIEKIPYHKPPRARRRFVGLIWTLLCLLLLIGLTAVFWPRELLLMQRATRMGRLPDLVLHNADNGLWLSAEEILLRDESPDSSEKRLLFARYNVATGARTPLEGLSKQADTNDYFSQMSLSPDGKQVLWAHTSASDHGATFVVTSLDGSHQRTWKEPEAEEGYWLRDSHQWIAFVMNKEGRYTHAIVHDIQAPSLRKALSLTTNCPLNDSNATIDSSGIVSEDQLVIDTGDWSQPTRFDEITELSLRDGGANARRHRVELPAKADIQNVLFAPQGDRAVWIVTIMRASSLDAFLHRFFPRHAAPERMELGLWVGKLDGSDMHEIGHLLLRPDEEFALNPYSVRWSPDGKRLLFLHTDTLYSIPAD